IAGPLLVTGNAFVLALATSMVIYAFTFLRGVTSETMVLVGIALMFTFGALLALMQYGATQVQLSQIVFWMMGSLSRASWTKIAVCLGVLAVTLPLFVARNWALTALRMGDDKAASLGINVKRVRVEMLVAISLLASTAVAFVGVVGFVGLVGPHIARMIVGEDQRFFLPFSMLASAVIMSATSIVSKAITPGIIYPIGIITSLIGIPFFLSLILATRRASWR
ncbi:MAG: iron ABC transporter permease, partial [Pseudomonadota bacterium]